MKFTLAQLAPFFLLTLSIVSYGQSTIDQKILAVVKTAESSWNATSPDKSFMSIGNTMQYGLDYLKAGNYSSASWSFEEVLQKQSNNPYANFFMGCVKLGLKDAAASKQYFDKAVSVNASLKESAAALISETGAKANNGNSQNAQAGKPGVTPVAQTGVNHYKVGDKVEVSHAGGWWPGVVTKVEGQDKSVYVNVDYTFQASKYNASFFYNGIRPATGNASTYQPGNKPGSALVYGDYTLSRGLGAAATRIGFFTLYANGTYTYFDVKGTYSYNPSTGVITWKSGTFYNWGNNTTTFTKGNRVSQIDMTYPQKAGPLYYSAGHNN